MKTYEFFSGKDLEIADLIQRRRLQLLIHSSIYYHFNTNIISDRQWDLWAKELVSLQKEYPNIASRVIWDDVFQDWDGTTGAFLPITDSWVIGKVQQLFGLSYKKVVKPKPIIKPIKHRLF